MSSKDYQVVKRMRKVQLNPQTSGGDAVDFSAKVKTIGSTRTGGNDRFARSFLLNLGQGVESRCLNASQG